MSSVSSVRKISDDLARNHLSDVDELGEEFSPVFFGPGKWTWDRKMSSGSVLSDSSRRSSQEERKKKSSDGSLHQYLDYLGERRRSSDASVILNGDTDSFIIGDRVWVGGTKPGQIAYIGETQFAPGDWAGVVLDEPIGKNDGSVANIRYFQCEAKKGVFSRLTRLTRYPILESTSIIDPVPSSGSLASAEAREARRSTSSLSATPPKKSSLTLTATPKTSISKPSSPDSALHPNVAVGDRVIVMSAQGSKAGVLRFMGPTDFAPGEWCGVELDDPLGKNDGSVAGTRYFECRPKFGLFAPVHKVSRSPASRRPSQANCQIHRRGSKESLVSATSSITSARSAGPRKVAARVPTTPTSTKNSLQDQLRTKEQHIEQLMRERELERAEITRAATQAEDAERRLVAAQREWQTVKEELETRLRQSLIAIDTLKNDYAKLETELGEERAKNEDLLFRFEEASIEKESITAETAVKLRALELEKTIATEDEQNRLFELEEELIQAKLKITQLQELVSTNADVKKELLTISEQFEAEKMKSKEHSVKFSEIVGKLEKTTGDLESAKKQLTEYEKKFEMTADDAGRKITELNEKIIQIEAQLLESEKSRSDLKEKCEKIAVIADEKIQIEQKLIQSEMDVKNLGNNLKSQQEETEKLLSEKAAVSEKLVSKTADAEKTEADLKKLKSDYEKLTHDLMSSGQESDAQKNLVSSLTADKSRLESQVREICADKEKLETEVKKLSVTLGDNEARLKELFEQLESQQKVAKSLEVEKTNLSSKLAEEISAKEKISHLGAESETEMKKLTQLLNQQQLDLSESLTKIANQQERINFIQGEKTNLESQLAEKLVSNSELHSQLQAKITELSQQEKKFEKLSQELDETGGKLTASKNEIDGLKTSQRNSEEAYKTKIQQFEFSVAELEAKLTSALDSRREIEEEKRKLATELSAFMNSSTDANAQLQSKHKELTEKDEKLQETHKELSDAKERILRLEQEIQKIVSKSAADEESLTAELAQSQQVSLGNSEKLVKITEDYKKLEELKIQLEIQQSSHVSTIQSLTCQLEDKLSEISAKNREIGELQSEFDKSCQLTNRQQEEIQQLTEKSAKFEGDLKMAAENLSLLKNQVEKMQQVENQLKIDGNEQVVKLRGEIEKLAGEKMAVEDRLANVTEEKRMVLSEMEKLRVEFGEEKNKEREGYVKEVEKLTQELREIKMVGEKAREEFEKLLEGKSAELNQRITTDLGLMKEKDELLDTVHIRLEDTLLKLKETETALEAERRKSNMAEQETEMAVQWKGKYDALAVSSTATEKSLTHLKQELENCQADLIKYKNGYEKLEKCQYETNDKLVVLEGRKKELEEQLKEISEQNKRLLTARENSELEKESLEKQLEIGNVLMAAKETEVNRLAVELDAMQAEHKAHNTLSGLLEDRNRLLEGREAECELLRRENQRLQEELRTAKMRKIDESNANISEGVIPAEEQIDFLNSVIVDMQKKNEALKARIQALELGDSPEDFAEYNLLNIKPRTVAPRLFCDICDRFDLHDTEDCPTQAMQEEDEEDAQPVRNPTKPKSKPPPPPPRPYCETCEVFGHDTADCDDAETF